jgi:hypothetical protein
MPVFVIPIPVKMEDNVFLSRQPTSVNVPYAILVKNVRVSKVASHYCNISIMSYTGNCRDVAQGPGQNFPTGNPMTSTGEAFSNNITLSLVYAIKVSVITIGILPR